MSSDASFQEVLPGEGAPSGVPVRNTSRGTRSPKKAALKLGTAAVSLRQTAPGPGTAPEPTAQPKPEPAPATGVAAATKRFIRLRAATARDITPLIDLLLNYFNECVMFYPGADVNACVAKGITCIRQGGCIVAESEGALIGCFAMELDEYWWNPAAKILNALLVYVLPEFRKGATGIKLIQAAQEVARLNNLPLSMTQIWKFSPELMERLNKRLGFHHVGGTFVYIPAESR